MGHYGSAALKDTNLWRLAQRYTLLDNYFQGALGGSFLNHIWLVCACAPAWPNPPKGLRSEVDEQGVVVRGAGDGGRGRQLRRQHNAVHIPQQWPPEAQTCFPANEYLPSATGSPTGEWDLGLGIRGGWSLAIKSRSPEEEKQLNDLSFQWRHEPFAYFARSIPRTKAGAVVEKRLKDAAQLEADIKAGTLPPVAFYKPIGVLNQHPGYANIVSADEEVGRIANLMDESPMKDSYALVITYDENGRVYDHVRRRSQGLPEAGQTSLGRARVSRLSSFRRSPAKER